MALNGNIDQLISTGYTLRLKWTETSADAVNNSSVVQVVAQLITAAGKSISSTVNKSISINCNGNVQSGSCNINTSASSTKDLYTATFTVPHNNDGSKTVSISGTLKLEANLNSTYYSSVTASGTATLTDFGSGSAGAPAQFTITAGYGQYVGLGDTIQLQWTAVTGATQYELQWQRGNSGWRAWKTQSGTSTTDVFTDTDISTNGAGKTVKYRVRAVGGSWKESNTLIITGGMQINVGGVWRTGTVWINVGGVWKRAKRVYTNNGTWQYSK